MELYWEGSATNRGYLPFFWEPLKYGFIQCNGKFFYEVSISNNKLVLLARHFLLFTCINGLSSTIKQKTPNITSNGGRKKSLGSNSTLTFIPAIEETKYIQKVFFDVTEKTQFTIFTLSA